MLMQPYEVTLLIQHEALSYCLLYGTGLKPLALAAVFIGSSRVESVYCTVLEPEQTRDCNIMCTVAQL